jgi:hypothetical protein
MRKDKKKVRKVENIAADDEIFCEICCYSTGKYDILF